jgi:hypothetical protein
MNVGVHVTNAQYCTETVLEDPPSRIPEEVSKLPQAA